MPERKNPAAAALSALGADQARPAKVKNGGGHTPDTAIDTSDQALLALLQRIKTTEDANEIRQLSNQLERVIFHKQFESA